MPTYVNRYATPRNCQIVSGKPIHAIDIFSPPIQNSFPAYAIEFVPSGVNSIENVSVYGLKMPAD